MIILSFKFCGLQCFYLEFLFFILGALIATYFTHLLKEPPLSGLEKHMNDPTTTGLETTDFPIWNIDFPGVTICPNTKVN